MKKKSNFKFIYLFIFCLLPFLAMFDSLKQLFDSLKQLFDSLLVNYFCWVAIGGGESAY